MNTFVNETIAFLSRTYSKYFACILSEEELDKRVTACLENLIKAVRQEALEEAAKQEAKEIDEPSKNQLRQKAPSRRKNLF